MDIIITKTAIKSIKKLDVPTRNRILKGINNLPLGDVKHLQGTINAYRLRVGDYRVIYSYLNNSIVVSKVLPRGEAYKEF